MRRNSFERFYYEKVALGEGCGCAEHVTRIRELDRLGGKLGASRSTSTISRPFAWVRQLARWIVGRRKTA